ncbi:MAG TPA: hypothetical protein VMX11_04645, partial [Actinomycetes bacterium]|nr:hypothetical protein [Actinomycetes bacterium]
VNPQPLVEDGEEADLISDLHRSGGRPPDWLRCPFGVVGDRLWVRETFACPETVRYYRADDAGILPPGTKWTPSIHMPRWASRLSLTITDVRVQRLQDISEADAEAEGLDGRDLFACTWVNLYGPKSWLTNPWVWAITFTKGTP